MAITDKKTGVWGLDQTFNKINQGSIWDYSGAPELWAWGQNEKGQLGQNSTSPAYSSPKQIPGTNWSSMLVTASTGSQEQANIRTDGTLWTWGNNASGQLGLNDTVLRSSPTQVGSGSDWAAVKSIQNAFMATKTNGTMWVWGANQGGTLGLNEEGNFYSSPVQLPGTWSTDPKKLGGGGSAYRAFAIKSDGTMWCWGDGNYGRLGLNDYPGTGTRRYSSPVQLTTATNWSHISDGNYGTLALNTDGEMFGWGDNADWGSLGLNDRIRRSSPTQIPGTWGWISSAYNAKYAVRSDGTAYSWGNNTYGQLGLNDTTKRSSPTQIPGTTWSKFSLNGGTSMIHAIKTDGTLWGWGWGSHSTIGVNNSDHYSSPVQIPGNRTDVSGDYNSTYAMKSL